MLQRRCGQNSWFSVCVNARVCVLGSSRTCWVMSWNSLLWTDETQGNNGYLLCLCIYMHMWLVLARLSMCEGAGYSSMRYTQLARVSLRQIVKGASRRFHGYNSSCRQTPMTPLSNFCIKTSERSTDQKKLLWGLFMSAPVHFACNLK